MKAILPGLRNELYNGDGVEIHVVRLLKEHLKKEAEALQDLLIEEQSLAGLDI